MRNCTLLTLLAVLVCLGPQAALAQRGITFSVDFQGPTGGGPGPFDGLPDFFGGRLLDEGSILTPGLPGPPGPNGPSLAIVGLPPPGRMVAATPIPSGLGIKPGLFGAVELDALSYGYDRGYEVFFSVDEFAIGVPLSPMPPNVFTQAAVGEASADIFYSRIKIMPPPPPGALGNTLVVDGNGMGTGLPGLGLVEPNPPSFLLLPDPGDNLDALDMNATMSDIMTRGVYFSLDSRFPDPFELAPGNSGTAVGNGFVGGDVLWAPVGGSPVVAIPAVALGLDLVPNAGPDSDDLDALALDATIYPGPRPGPSILFSVRRGSAVIGKPDSLYGVPIEPGDILTLPVAGGISPFPSIWIPAEALGLATRRTNPQLEFGDDLDALDLCPHAGDADYSGAVNVGDLGILAANWKQPGTWDQADYNGDGIVNVGDLGILAANWNWTFNPLSPVPEPGTLGLMALAGLALIRRRARRQ